MQLIQHVTVESGGAASITFSGIPQTFTDLVLVASLRENANATLRSSVVRFNGNSSNVYQHRLLQGDGSSASSASATTSSFVWMLHNDTNSTSNTFSNCQMHIFNYRSANQKSVSMDSVAENNATFGLQRLNAGLWLDTSAVTSITLSGEASNLVAGSSASLYGITAGSSGGVTVS